MVNNMVTVGKKQKEVLRGESGGPTEPPQSKLLNCTVEEYCPHKSTRGYCRRFTQITKCNRYSNKTTKKVSAKAPKKAPAKKAIKGKE